MSLEIITREDLELFGQQLLKEIKKLFEKNKKEELHDWLKSCEVTKLLKMSPAKLQNLRINKRVHGVKIDGTWYYNLESIKSLFDTCEDN